MSGERFSIINSMTMRHKTSGRDVKNWTWFRTCLGRVVESSRFESALGVVIMANVVVIILETDHTAMCSRKDADEEACGGTWIFAVNMIFLALYSVESLARLYVQRYPEFFKDRWNVFDLSIVIFGYTDLIITQSVSGDVPNLQMLRLFRVTRLLRAVRILRSFPELHSMLQGFIGATSTMFWGFIIIIVLLMIWAVISVELMNPYAVLIFQDGEECASKFSSVAEAMLFFFQTLVAGDSWGTCAVPFISLYPVTAIVFAGALMSVQVGFANIILAVIVEKANDVKEADVQKAMKDQELRKTNAKKRLYDMCEAMDIDGNGYVTIDELLQAFEEEGDMQDTMMMLGIDVKDLRNLFSLMDSDDSGDLSYDEIIDCFYRADSQDVKRQMMFLKLQLQDIMRTMRQAFPRRSCTRSMSALSVPESKPISLQVGESKLQRGETKPISLQRAQSSVLQDTSDRLQAELALLKSKLDEDMTHLTKIVLENRPDACSSLSSRSSPCRARTFSDGIALSPSQATHVSFDRFRNADVGKATSFVENDRTPGARAQRSARSSSPAFFSPKQRSL